MFSLKLLSEEAIPAAIEKAVRYRLLNEPGEAESICHDVLRIDPENQQALVVLLLSLTDEFGNEYAVGSMNAMDVLPRLRDAYDRAYYEGIICERKAKFKLIEHNPRSQSAAYELLREAMAAYEKAEAIRPANNDDSILRWNACARMIMENKLTEPKREKPDLQLE